MVTSFLRKIWIELLIALDPMVTLEGFELTGMTFVLEPNSSDLEPGLKRRLTICNLFINHRQSIVAIARVLDTSKGRVVSVLIEEGAIKERRRAQPRQVKRDRRRPLLTLPPLSPGLRVVGTTPTGARPITRSLPRFQTLFGTESPDVTYAIAQSMAPPATTLDSQDTDNLPVAEPAMKLNSTRR